jgi:hypothetical protein
MLSKNTRSISAGEFRKFFRKGAIALTILLLVFTPILFFNLVIDPYGVFLQGFKHALLEPNKRYLKVKFMLDNPGKFDSFIFGSSRVNFIDPDKIKEDKYFNMTYSSGVPRDHFEDIQLMVNNGVRIKNLIIGIDFLSLLENPAVKENDLLRKPYPVTWHDKFHFFTDYLFFLPGWQMINLAFTDMEVDRFKPFTTGIDNVPIYDSIIDCAPGSFIKEEKFSTPFSWYITNPDIKNALNEIENLVRFAKENQINLRFFINPTHIVTYLNMNLDAYFEALRRLVKITDFYDFGGLNSICIDNINFLETSHYRSKTGDMIIARLFHHPYPGIPDDFGRYVNKDNIEEQINFHQRLAESYFKGLEGKGYFRSSLDIVKMKMRQEPPLLALEKLNEVDADILNQPITITTPMLKLQGWAVDQPGNCLASEVFIQIDKNYFKASYGQERKHLQPSQRNKKLMRCGWDILIPTPLLGEGSHTLKFGIVCANKSEYQISDKSYNLNVFCTKQVPEKEKMRPLNSPLLFGVSWINGTDARDFKFVGNSTFLYITGWAIDEMKNSPSSAIIAVLNGKHYPSNVKAERPDLAEKFNNPLFAKAGWSVTIPCSSLGSGEQVLTFLAINDSGTGYFRPSDTILFYNIVNGTTENLDGLRLSPERTDCFIDVINGIHPDKVSGTIQIKDQTIKISGWAVDGLAKKPAGGVLVAIDGKLLKTYYGANRSDVAVHFKNPNYKKCGWYIEIPVKILAPGNHKLSLKILSNDKLTYFNIDKQITIKTN